MTIPDVPYTREEMYLSAIAEEGSGGIPAVPYTRREQYLAAIATGDASGIPDVPYTREEMYLDEIARNGGGGGGGGGGGTLSEEWDFTSATPLVGIKRGITLTQKNVTFDANGAVFASTQSGIALGNVGGGNLFFSTTIEAKVKSMDLTSSDHRRFIMGTPDSGLIYRSTGAWGFYSNGWDEFSETDGGLFSNSVIKVIIDNTNHWHIYKDEVLLWEPARSLIITNGYVGSNGQSINNAVIEWLKIEAGTA